MFQIFIGYIFIFFHITIGELDILADFIGYILIYVGLNKFPEIENFEKAKPWAIAMVVISFFSGFTMIALVGAAISIYIMYLIVAGIEELEQNRRLNLNSKKISAVWTLHVLATIITYFLAMVFSELAGWFALAVVIVDIVFLYYLYQVENALELYSGN